MYRKLLREFTGKELSKCTTLELFNAALYLTQDACINMGYNTGKKKVYYICAEYLTGKLLSNNLINLGLYHIVQAELAEAGRDITELEEYEYEPALGNGGLGRLAACNLDGLATLGIPADGLGVSYRCGLFKQTFKYNKQYACPDHWRKWGTANWMRRTDKHYKVKIGGRELVSTMYEIDVPGYGGKCARLRLFDLDSVDERLIGSDITFDKTEIEKNLTLTLYPDDNDDDGKMLRLSQEYFMVSNAAQLILEECEERGSNLHDLADYAAIQINDTHPSLVIPELVRLLTEKGIEEKEAYQIVTDVCAYTNHTILAEALETWHLYFLNSVVPDLVPIIERMDNAVKAKHGDPGVHIIDGYGNVHMARLSVHYCHSVNGVAQLHTEIIKNRQLTRLYQIHPDRFNNKTNGITFRRWVIECNPELTELISEKIGEGWKTDATQLEKLLDYVDDPEFLRRILDIKDANKSKFAVWLEKNQKIKVDPASVFDVQIKRLHLYKRQQLLLLWAIDMYRRIKHGYRPHRKITVIIGAKAANSYDMAKNVIHAILTFSQIVNNDPDVNAYLEVVMPCNYNVTMAEKLIPATDISEHPSLASKEASGTSNMKFVLNAGLICGTMDGANVEIYDLVGEENIFIFGASANKVLELETGKNYKAEDLYNNDSRLRDAVDFLISEEMLNTGDREALRQLHDDFKYKDQYMALLDFESYCEVKDAALAEYEDRMSWARKMVVNVAKAGFFSIDRTVSQYNDEIWHVERDC